MNNSRRRKRLGRYSTPKGLRDEVLEQLNRAGEEDRTGRTNTFELHTQACDVHYPVEGTCNCGGEELLAKIRKLIQRGVIMQITQEQIEQCVNRIMDELRHSGRDEWKGHIRDEITKLVATEGAI